MFYLEFKRSIHNKTIIYLMTVTVVAFVMGWGLPFSLEHITAIEDNYYMFSTYTVFTQFGFLLFGFVTSYFFNKDYKDKNTIFYSCFKINVLKYYMIKISILFIEEIICIAGGLLIVGVLFDSFEYFLPCFLLYTAVVFQYFIVVGAISLIFKSLLISLGASIIYWISSIVIVSFGGICKYFAVFDASNSLYNHVEKYFSQGISVPAVEFTDPVIGFGFLLIAALIIIFGTSKKWIKKGL